MKDSFSRLRRPFTKKKKAIPVRRWLIGAFILFTVVMVGLLWFSQTVFLEPIYKSIKKVQIKETAASISASIFDTDLQDDLEEAVSDQPLCAMVIDSHGAIVSSADTLPFCSIHHMRSFTIFYLYVEAMQSGGFYLCEVSSEEPGNGYYSTYDFLSPHIPVIPGKESIIYVTVVSDHAGNERILLLNSVVTPLNTTVQTIRAVLVVVTAVMLLLGIGISLFLARRIANPIIRINDSAKGLAKYEYTPYTGTVCREIQELDATLSKACADLNQVEQLRRDLLANISHDLRTPLTLITGYAEVMRDLPGENTPENVQIIIDESSHLTELVNDLLDLSKLQAGVVTIQPECFCLTQLVRETLTRYNKMMENKGFCLTLEASEELWVEADRTRISQVIYNLINNAIHYTGKTLEVRLRQTAEKGFVKLEVIDQGEGIPADKLPLVWDRYYKLDKVHKRSAVGTGLGLSIVRGVLELHHAQYGVESTVGVGSDFWFKLPVVPPPLE